MLLNSNLQSVTKDHDILRASMPAKKWERVRPSIVADLHEVLFPNREHVGKMFRLGERAVLK